VCIAGRQYIRCIPNYKRQEKKRRSMEEKRVNSTWLSQAGVEVKGRGRLAAGKLGKAKIMEEGPLYDTLERLAFTRRDGE
jgi:hypothetical protein